MVFYRKYRPQTINDLDNAEVRENLSALLKNEVPHAFLFTGPKGLGKTSTARIVAKVVNCTTRNQESRIKNQEKKENKNHDSSFMMPDSSMEPCNTCDACTTITNGTNLDILEIDAASNRGIDEIRDLKEKIRLAPLSVQKKVYIIDEVHMLTTEAFNALLKTLEEPPSHVVFILCTTELHKVPTTILSRSFHIAFHLATTDELVRSFKRIVAGEKLTINPEALTEIARLSEGGFRDGAKIFEEVVALAKGKEITRELIEEVYQIKGLFTHTTKLLAAFLGRDRKGGLSVIQELVSQGTDIKYFVSVCIDTLHQELLKRTGVEGIRSDLDLPGVGTETLTKLLRVFMQVQFELKSAVLMQLPLELALLEWCGTVVEETIEVKNTLEENEEQQATIETTVQTEKVVMSTDSVSVASLRKQVGNIAKIKALYGETKEVIVKETITTSDLNLMHVPNDGMTQEWLTEFWRSIISEMKQHNHTLAGVLRGCMIREFDKKNLIIQTAFKFHKEKLDDARTKQLLEQVCKGLIGNPVSVSIELKAN